MFCLPVEFIPPIQTNNSSAFKMHAVAIHFMECCYVMFNVARFLSKRGVFEMQFEMQLRHQRNGDQQRVFSSRWRTVPVLAGQIRLRKGRSHQRWYKILLRRSKKPHLIESQEEHLVVNVADELVIKTPLNEYRQKLWLKTGRVLTRMLISKDSFFRMIFQRDVLPCPLVAG